MSRFRTLGAPGVVLAAALVVGACQSSASPSASGGGVSLPPIASVLPSGTGKAFVQFQAVGGSNITGGALVNDLGGGKTAIIVGVVGANPDVPMAGLVYEGDCTTPPTLPAQSPPPPSPSAGASAEASAAPSAEASAGASASASAEASVEASLSLPPGQFKLGDLNAGTSSTTIEVGLNDLLSSPHSIALFKSPFETTLVACGTIVATLPSSAPASSAPSAETSSSPEASTAPSGSASTAP